jgi:hypothetical protein
MRQVHIHAMLWSAMKEQLGQTLIPARGKHEALHEQLPAAVEQVGKRAPALRRFENRVFIDVNPGERAAPAGDLVA